MAIEYLQSNLPVLLLFNLDLTWSENEKEEVLNVTSQLDDAIRSLGYRTIQVPVTGSDLDSVFADYDPLEHIVFNWCEIIPGIDHSEPLVAKYLEEKGYTFTGASSAAISLAQDKIRIKQLMDDSGILTPDWRIFARTSKTKWKRFPAIVKTTREHCSEGIDRNSVVMNEAELTERVKYIWEKYRQPAMVEDFIDGRELHVSLWENGAIDMLPPAEMEFSSFLDKHDHICSYEAKFIPGSESYNKINTILPAPLSEEELHKLENISKDAFVAAGCRDYARMDIRLKDGKFYVIDINPNSDISPDTSTIAAAEIAGFSYGEFGSRIIEHAAQRHPVYGTCAADDYFGIEASR